MVKEAIIVFGLSLSLSCISTPFLLKMLAKSNCLCQNYKNEEIPVGMGLMFIIVQVIVLSFLFIIKRDNYFLLVYSVSFVLMGMIGMIDDLIGDKSIKGFKGHIRALTKGTLTTGMLKALIGFFISLFVSIVISENTADGILNIFLIALFINFINLFDLRPGRALKMFLFISIFFLLTTKLNVSSLVIFSFYGIIIRYLPLDLKAKAMMGDVGSNILGLTLGIYCALNYTFHIKLIYLAVLILIQIVSEFFSFSSIIEKSRFLKFIDNLGR
jgi:UDP-N-acetylmuramyl pentapeptide phosphotransferase/UDP-N-acetylglucosamine-1-phosphate transferase